MYRKFPRFFPCIEKSEKNFNIDFQNSHRMFNNRAHLLREIKYTNRTNIKKKNTNVKPINSLRSESNSRIDEEYTARVIV